MDTERGTNMATDPAVEAAKRALKSYDRELPSTLPVAAVREALKPIREWYEKQRARIIEYYIDEWTDGTNYMREQMLKELAPLIFSDEELDV